ncbi:hypothetical protein EC991_010990, partial [Linnemannia zychae]
RGICVSAPKDAHSLDADDDVKQEQGHILRSSIGSRGGIVIEVADDDNNSMVNGYVDVGSNDDDDEHDDHTDGDDIENIAESRKLSQNEK